SDVKPGQISIIFVKAKKGYDPGKIYNDITDSIIEVNPVARKDIGKSLVDALRDINRIFMVTVALASILSVFLTWAVFSAVANERAREVGIMRAIGAKESHVVKLFLLEVFVISAVGSVVGITGGTALSMLLAKGFSIMKNVSIDLNILERIVIACAGLCAGIGVCVAGALLPIMRLKKMEPLLAIKEE
ncbi:MAG TPA: ABC transporter permease, partial [Dissulfurispiraceae bacterium]